MGKNPTEIVDNFFNKQQENFSEEEKINLLLDLFSSSNVKLFCLMQLKMHHFLL